ncbi:MAG: MerR family transcriptional regulator [Cellulosilyticum sp.]|nr:MerR family transcriptional regulator [Cellulosilyticum sp.]
MLTVNEVSKLTGVSIRTLHYYDEIGLLQPTTVTQAGYRLYDDLELERLQQILLFRELEFSLKEISEIINSKNFEREKAIDQQIELLTLKKEHIEDLILLAKKMKKEGTYIMEFKAFDTSKIDDYTKRAKEQWGNTNAYKEFEEKNKKRSKKDFSYINEGLMSLFREFGTMMEEEVESEKVQHQVEKLQTYITEHYYTCTTEILAGLGQMYSSGGEFTKNIDTVGGEGCSQFTARAIEIYCKAH